MTNDEYSKRVLDKAVNRICAVLELEQGEGDFLFGYDGQQAGNLDGDPIQSARAIEKIKLVQLYQLLITITGSDAAARCWLRSMNDALKGTPLDLMQSQDGLDRVLHYLESVALR